MKVKNKCEGCGGNLKFNPDKQGLYCENCGSVTPIEYKPFVKKKFLTADSSPKKQQSTAVNLKCESCGANLNINDVIETTCPYCGSHQINCVDDGLEYIPDSIIPFGVSRARAENIFKLWIKKRKFAPNNLKTNAILGEMKGMYFPCWLYDYKTSSVYQGVGVNTRRDNDGNTYEVRKPVSGTRNNMYFNQIEPANDMLDTFNIEQFRDYTSIPQHEYNSSFVLGFLTANNTCRVVPAFEREKKQKAYEIEDQIKTSLPYERIDNFRCTTTFSDVMWSYTLLPLWVCDYEYKKKKFRFLINGKTGSIVGKAPKSGWKIFFTTLGVLLGVGAIIFLIMYLGGGNI